MSASLADPIKMLVRQAGDVRIHTFVASFSDDNIADATHIIESKNQLVLVDAQFLSPYAKQFRDYADSLKKPIERLYLTHRHPDHWFGIGTAFADVPIYTLSETQQFIRDKGEESRQSHVAILGPYAPERIIVPQKIVDLAPLRLDGVQYVFSKVVDTEIDYHLIIELPELKTAIVQDLIYSGTHLYLTKSEDLGHWMDFLGKMLLSEHDLFLPGHGLPADKIEVARNFEYLATARAAIDRGLKNTDFEAYMLKRYPDRLCKHIFDIYMPRLFDGARDH